MSKAGRDRSVRERVQAQREAERKQDKRKKAITYTVAGVVAVAAIGAGWLYAANQSQSEEAAATLAPVTVQGDGTVAMGKAGVTAPVLDIYEDFQCPACRQLEEVSGATFKNLALEGKAKVVYHPITIFPQDMNKGITRANSVRAGAAARCVPDGKQWVAYHDRIFKGQPAESSEGFTTDDLVSWGKDVGVSDPGFESCVTTQKYAQSHIAYSDKVNKEQNLQGTPTVKMNGKDMDNQVIFNPQELRKAVLDAAK
jgi:protein-disulfide isomerase